VVICLERGADLHMAQLMPLLLPLPLAVFCFSKIQIGFTFRVPAHPGSPGQRAVKWVYVCVCVFDIFMHRMVGARGVMFCAVCPSVYVCTPKQRHSLTSLLLTFGFFDQLHLPSIKLPLFDMAPFSVDFKCSLLIAAHLYSSKLPGR